MCYLLLGAHKNTKQRLTRPGGRSTIRFNAAAESPHILATHRATLQLPGARPVGTGLGAGRLGGKGMEQQGQSTLEWVIGAAVILGTFATQRDHLSNHGVRTQALG
jgi:hypothetical protein